MLANSRLYAAVRNFSVSTPIWAEQIRHEVMPDERYDLTLVSQRVYGNRDEFLAVMAAAGLDRVNSPLEQQVLVLPTIQQLDAMKKKVGL